MLFRLFLAGGLLASLFLVSGAESHPLRYVAVGDSYTIGTGIDAQGSWPAQLTRRLSASGIKIDLTANLAKGGWTTREAVELELPLLATLKPDFATLLIGLNDWVHEAASRPFTNRLRVLMDGILENLSPGGKLLVITLPDFSCSPRGKKWGYGKSAINGISRFNRILKSEAASRQLPVVDIYALSQEACSQPGMFAGDGLHPSAAQYSQWVELIFPAALELLKSVGD